MNDIKSIKQGINLEYATLAWNVVGVFLLSIIAPAIHSVALIAFGFDTLIEIGASIVVIWELSGKPGSRQKKALKYLSMAFLFLGTYLSIQSSYNLLYHILPRQSVIGVVWLILTIFAMVLLAVGKYRVGKKINNSVLLAEGRVTLVDASLAFLVLTGFLATTLLEWWWADSIAGLILMLYCFWESRHTWKESNELTL